MTPTSPMTSWTADFALSKSASVTWDRLPVAAPQTSATATSNHQMALSTGSPLPRRPPRLLWASLPDMLASVKRARPADAAPRTRYACLDPAFGSSR